MLTLNTNAFVYTTPGNAPIFSGTVATITTGAASANVALPLNSAGSAANRVRLSCTAACHVKFGVDNTVAATAADIFIAPGPGEIFSGVGYSWIAAIQDAAGGKLQIEALDN